MNDYLAVIYRKDVQALSNLLQTRSRHVQSHLDEALKVVLTDYDLEPHIKVGSLSHSLTKTKSLTHSLTEYA